MALSDFDYPLPAELIAREPLPERDASRLLRLPRSSSDPFEHRTFRELPTLLEPGDLLVVNDAKVVRARLRGHKAVTGGKVELLLDRPLAGGRWLCLGQAAKSFAVGQELALGEGLRARIEEVRGGGWLSVWIDGDPFGGLAHGELPLPPYLERPPTPEDDERYQTVFAAAAGAVAAPTAGLHFTPRVLAALAQRGVRVERLTLFVGAGTFLPVRTERIEDHRMHPERYEIPEALARAVADAPGRVVAVGTTCLRALEAAWDGAGVKPGPGETDLFVRPGYRFEAVDGLLTNFHLPRSTLLMLVAALAGRERVLAAYAEAVARRYRFFSYGDCMLIL
ncbi:MAG TPA: tRNA preQ1(34) S-adenosylmethionine ribosyltransferase-isomerase QueA [Myxococcales bacterium]|nr:tRNA preQ1(34) S-adenosylmethionine ribosyltransferase-isomerase QueA [Myxococcales bacterium]